jgi:hypothetical protein
MTLLAGVLPVIVSCPGESLFMPTPDESWKVGDTAYQSLSPLPSRRSGKPKVRHGKRPILLAQVPPPP